jgi:Protein of unknown function (DUF3108)
MAILDPRRCAAIVSLLICAAESQTAFGENWESSLSPHAAGSLPEQRPMHVKYGFGWNGITAAEAEFHIFNTADRLQLDATGHTVGLARTLWNFEVTHMSLTDAHTLRPLQVRESETVRSKKVDTELSFTPQGVNSKREEHRGSSVKSKTRDFELANIHSIDSALLYLRTQPLKPEGVQRIVVYPSNSAYLCTITPSGRDHITVPTGSYDAIKLDLQLSKIGKNRELLPHKKFRRATVWLSDDPNRLVLRIEAQIFAGTVFAELQSLQFDDGKP